MSARNSNDARASATAYAQTTRRTVCGAERTLAERYRNDREAYTDAKSEFIHRTTGVEQNYAARPQASPAVPRQAPAL
jgi:hypothetical protein